MLTIVKNKKNIFILITWIVVIASVLPDLLRHGMFMDGTQYACVSKNLADGKSSFWLPFLNSAWDKHHVNYFLEHPPLVYYLQSKFFILCNNSFLSERIYCIFTLLLCIFFINKIWKLLFDQDKKLQDHWWLPVLIWIIIPSVPWSFRNNMHENTLSVFILAATFFGLKSIYSSKGILNVIATGACIFLATLSKGLPGLFPLSILIVHYFIFKKLSLKKTLLYSFVLFLVPALIYCIIYFSNDDARFSLDFYVQNRLLDRINNNPEVRNRFTILLWLLIDLLIPLALTGLLLLVFKTRSFTFFLKPELKKLILFFILFAFTGIIPLTFTHVQRAVYFVPAMPFVGFAFAVFLVMGIQSLAERINEKTWKVLRSVSITALIITIGICIYLFGKTGRDAEQLNTAKLIAEKVGENKVVGTSFEIHSKWDLQFYLLRYYNITIDATDSKIYEYKMLGKKEEKKDLSGFIKIGEVKEYELYKRN